MKHYVYKLSDPVNGHYYFGSRSHKEPENDDYMGSMKTWKPEDKSRLVKEIIRDDFNTRETAIEFEDSIIGKHIHDKLNKNYHRPSTGFSMYGVKFSEEHKNNISKTRIENELAKGSNNPMYNKKHSDATIDKMKERAKNRYTLEWFIEHYGEGKGERLYNEKREEHSKKISGKNHPRYGVHGKDNPLYGRVVSEETKRKISKTKSKKILQFSKDSIFIREWGSVKEASEYYNIYINSIYHNLKGRRSHAHGYLWKYK
jgi:hypothetical protein